MLTRKHLLRPVLFALIVFSILLYSSWNYISFKRGQWEKNIRNNLLEILISKKSKIEKTLFSRIYYTKGVAAFVSLKPNITNEEFDKLARDFMYNDPVISSLSLSRNCILNAIYPYQGHESAIGLDLLKHPKRREIVEQTIATRKTFVAGPVELVEGGVAVISYTPIFDKTVSDSGSFWGVTDIVIYLDQLLKESSLSPVENIFGFALKGIDGKGWEGDCFFGDEKIFEMNPVIIEINLPNGKWILAAAPVKGWISFMDQDRFLLIILLISSLIISILIGVITQNAIKIKSQKNELEAIFESMDNLIIEFNENATYLKVVSSNPDQLIKPAGELLGKNVYDFFKPEMAKIFHDAIKKCIKTKSLQIIEYPVDFEVETQWFLARLSYKKENRVIFNAYNITEKRNREEVLKKSEIRLNELNATKDKFFSILAHDLRGPLSSFHLLTELLLTEFDSITDLRKKELLNSIYDGTKNINDLFENLLEWSNSQQNRIAINLKNQALDEAIGNVVGVLREQANQKSITFKLDFKGEINALFDSNMTKTIFRNLISNAIKFSNSGAEILIFNELVLLDNKKMQRISVQDSGIGIEKNQLDQIYSSKYLISNPGTNNEKGSGLGLILCKEFIEKQGGVLEIVSTPGKGSTFSVSLPVV